MFKVMRKKLLTLVTLLMVTFSAFAQADKIVGTYKAVQAGVNSKVKISKVGDGYKAQIIWVDNLINEDGTTRTDTKNPDKAKRNTPANKIVLIEKVTYNEKGQSWENGKIYDPTRGKSFKVVCSFKDAKTLKVKGSFGPFSETVYWTKLD